MSVVESMNVSVIKWKFFKLLDSSSWVAGIENWVITYVFVLQIASGILQARSLTQEGL